MRCKSHQALLVEIYFEGFTAEDQHVKSEVKLEAVHQVWIGHVLLDNVSVISWNLVDIVGQENALALTAAVGFDNHGEFAYLVCRMELRLRLPIGLISRIPGCIRWLGYSGRGLLAGIRRA